MKKECLGSFCPGSHVAFTAPDSDGATGLRLST